MRIPGFLLSFFFLLPFVIAEDVQPSTDSPQAPTSGASQEPGSGAAPSPAVRQYSLYDQFHRGGFWMWPILGLSFMGVAFALERIVNMRRSKILPPLLHSQLNGSLDGKDTKAIQDLCRKHPSCLGRILLAGLDRTGMPLAEMERATDEQSQRELYDLRKNVRPLGIVANTAPMFGLLGTVSGMISAFDVVAAHGALGDPKLLSSSIAEALLTTGFGLIVAIPALILFHYFRGHADNLIVEISDITDHVLQNVERRSTNPQPSQHDSKE